jgi:hypothetical protein
MPLNRITQASLAWNFEVINNRADLDIYDSSAHIVGAKPTLTLTGMNAMLYLTLVSGIGAMTWTVGNADDQTGTGSVAWTMSPSMNPLGDYTGAHGQYATGNLTMMGLAADGLTNPVSYTVLTTGAFLGPKAMTVSAALKPVKEGPPMMGLGNFGRVFKPPVGVSKAPAADAPADAVVLPVDPYARMYAGAFRGFCRLQMDGAKALGLDPDQVAVRTQGTDRIITPREHVNMSLMHRRGSELAGTHRYDWHRRDDGMLVGYLTDAAREADEELAYDYAS